MAGPTCPLCAESKIRPMPSVCGRSYFRCQTCALAYMAPEQRPALERERSRYRLHKNDPADERYRQFLSRASDPLIPLLPPGAQGLDYGCGSGPALSGMLRARGFGMRDYDPCFVPDQDALKLTYDFITCTETVEHFHRPAEEFRRLDGLLRPGGWLAVMTEMVDETDERFAQWHYVRDETHVCFYSRQTMRWIAHRHGWTASAPSRTVTLFCKSGGLAGTS